MKNPIVAAIDSQRVADKSASDHCWAWLLAKLRERGIIKTGGAA
jgi:hypothetical protein